MAAATCVHHVNAQVTVVITACLQWEIYTLFKAFKQYNIQPLPPAAVSRAQPKCVPVVIQGPPPEGWVVRPAETGSSGDSASGAAVGVAAALQKQEQGSIMNDY
jgi:hypothetical protein